MAAHDGAARGADHKNCHESFSTAPCPLQPETVFIRREECRKCEGDVWALYYFTSDGNDCGWGCRPIDACGQPDRCGEKLQWLYDGDLALYGMRPGGSA